MEAFDRIFRDWFLISVAFLTLSVGALASFSVLRALDQSSEHKRVLYEIIRLHIQKEKSAIAEEIYFKLDSLSEREKILQKIMGETGKIFLEFHKDESPDPKSQALSVEEVVNRWSWDLTAPHHTVNYPVYFGDNVLGMIDIKVHWNRTWTQQLGSLAKSLALVGFLMAGFWILGFLVFKRKVFQPIVRNVLAMERDSAIAKTVQMLAHDVRRPLILIQYTRNLLGSAKSLEETREILHDAELDLDRALVDANAMIEDMMEVGRTSALKAENGDLGSIISGSVRSVLAIKRVDEIALGYDLQHASQVRVDHAKVRRLISNIFQNAIEAAGVRGKVWIVTRDLDDNIFVEVRIGNNGPAIAKRALSTLFTPFYTAGKPGGTGLGLAVARAVVESHGGSIWCESCEERGTEFVFTLPVADARLAQSGPMPADFGSTSMPAIVGNRR